MRAAVLLSMLVAAAPAAYATELVTPDRAIVGIQVLEGVAIITLDQALADVEGCANSNSESVAIDLMVHQSLYSSVLAAATSKQRVGFVVEGCSGGELDYPLAVRVSIGY